MRNNGVVFAFHTMPRPAPRSMMRHTTHLTTTLRPATRRKHARSRTQDVVREGRASAQAAATAFGGGGSDADALHAQARSYAALERGAGGPQDRALYGCACGYAFLAAVEVGVHCPHCDAEQSW